jgi:hypothetical protein
MLKWPNLKTLTVRLTSFPLGLVGSHEPGAHVEKRACWASTNIKIYSACECRDDVSKKRAKKMCRKNVSKKRVEKCVRKTCRKNVPRKCAEQNFVIMWLDRSCCENATKMPNVKSPM